MENGLVNAGNQLSVIAQDGITKNVNHLSKTLIEISKETNQTIQTFGIEQMKTFKKEYSREINLVIYGWLLICLMVFLIGMRFLMDIRIPIYILFLILIKNYSNTKVMFILTTCIGFLIGIHTSSNF